MIGDIIKYESGDGIFSAEIVDIIDDNIYLCKDVDSGEVFGLSRADIIKG